MKKIDILQAPYVKEMIETTSNLYRLGWDERNGGNISYLLKEEITPFLDPEKVIRRISMIFDASRLAGCYFIVTGSGRYFKNVASEPAENLESFELLKMAKHWNFCGGWKTNAFLQASCQVIS